MPRHRHDPGPQEVLTTQDYVAFRLLVELVNDLRQEVGAVPLTWEVLGARYREAYAAIRRGAPWPTQKG